MRLLCLTWSVSLLLVAGACSPRTSPSSAPDSPTAAVDPGPAVESEAVLNLRFAGAASLRANPHAVRLQTMTGLPEVARKWQDVLGRLAAHAPGLTGWQGDGSPQASRLLPLLQDLVEHGFQFSWRKLPGTASDWMLVVRLSTEQAQVWEKNLSAWLAPGQPGAIASLAKEGVDGWQTTGMGRTWRLIRSQGKVGVWSGAGAEVAVEASAKQLEQARPALEDGESWLTMDANGPASRVIAGLTRGVFDFWLKESTGTTAGGVQDVQRWDGIQLTLASRDDFVRTEIHFKSASPLVIESSKWDIPSKTIADPLISFTGIQRSSTIVQSILPWLGPQDVMSTVGIGDMPDQLYVWGMANVPFQTYAAWPQTAPADHLRQLRTKLDDRWGTVLKNRSMGSIQQDTEASDVRWVGGLPMIVPFLSPARDAGYMMAGIFPMADLTNAPPAELLSQVEGRGELVYYNWEITQARVVQWNLLNQLMSMIKPAVGLAPGAPATPAPVMPSSGPWLQSLATNLGSSVTEISLANPNELVLRRKSHCGLTALELVILSRWFNHPEFPLLEGSSNRK